MATRREFMKTSAVLAAAAAVPDLVARGAYAGGTDVLRVGLIGCGGRGTGAAVNALEAGAAVNALEAGAGVEVVALADVFQDRLDGCLQHLTSANSNPHPERVKVSADRKFVGFDAYKQLLATDVNLVILATPPGFRPAHLAAAVAAGKHVFMEKPVAVDGPGVRAVLAAGALADSKRLCIVAGTQRRHEPCYLEAMKRVRDGGIGRIVSARCYWNQGGLWMNERQSSWTDMEWQLRNWLYFAWLSGDHIVEQHVHNLDAVNWALDAHPVRAMGMGGRQVRTSPAYGHIFDHFAIEYEYPGGVTVSSMCRQIGGCDGRVEEVIEGTDGVCQTTSGRTRIRGRNEWAFKGENGNPYVHEHTDLQKAIATGTRLNEAKQIAESTLTAIMGRMTAYTGKSLSWEQALNSTQDLLPATLAFGPLATPEVAVPGQTAFE